MTDECLATLTTEIIGIHSVALNRQVLQLPCGLGRMHGLKIFSIYFQNVG